MLRPWLTYVLSLVLAALVVFPQNALALRGDTNCDAAINFDDIDPFIKALSGQVAYETAYPNCQWLNADTNNSGSVNFDDIDPFIALLSSCGSNQPPLANAGPDQTGQPGETLTFNGSGSSDPDGTSGNLSYNWQFGDTTSAQGVIVSHSYSQAGTYTVSLRVQDPCGAQSLDQLTVNVVGQGEPVADFVVEKLTHKDFFSGAETWVPVGLSASDPVELGLKVRFRSTSSGNIGYLSWQFWDGTWGSNPIERKRIPEPGPHTVTLSVYSPDWVQYDSITKTVYADQGMQHVTTTPVPGMDFRPMAACISGQIIWAVSANGALGWLGMSDPLHPDGIHPVPTEPLHSTVSIACHAGYIFIANRTSGVAIFTADPSNFTPVGHITMDQNNGPADFVAVVGEYLYVVSAASGNFRVYSLAQPASPAFVTSRMVNQYIWAISSPGSDYIVFRCGASSVQVWDARNPANPTTSPALTLSVPGAGSDLAVETNGGIIGVPVLEPQPTGRTQLILVNAGPTGVTISSAGVVPHGTYRSLVAGDRFYVNTFGAGLWVYDVTDRNDPYLLHYAYTSTDEYGCVVYYTTPAAGEPYVLAGYRQLGFRVLRP